MWEKVSVAESNMNEVRTISVSSRSTSGSCLDWNGFRVRKGLYFPPEGRKIMIGIADVKLLNLGMLFPFVEVES